MVATPLRSLKRGFSALNLTSHTLSSPAATKSRYLFIRKFFNAYVISTSGVGRAAERSLPSTMTCHTAVGRSSNSLHRWRKNFSTKAEDEADKQSESSPQSDQNLNHPPKAEEGQPPPTHLTNHLYQTYPRFLRRLAASLPESPHLHRPTRDDFLNVANNMWDRMRIRFKWLTIRGFRKFNADDISAFFSWFLVGQTLWIFIGTTTFVSVIFGIANSLSMQSGLAHLLSDYLTAETGIQIVFESAIVPKWKDSRICFENVYVSRRPGNAQKLPMNPNQGSREATRLLSIGDHHHHPGDDHDHEENVGAATSKGVDIADPPSDVTYFDLNIDSVAVTLSLWRWWNGKGIITDAEVKGVRGVMDRRHLTEPTPPGLDPASTRHNAQTGDFQLEALRLEDILITIYQPHFRPFTASIFTADLSQFRKQWLFYDLLSADNMVGQFDNCLFSVHRPQSINRTMGGDSKDATWKRMSRFRIDGVNIDHLQYLTDTDGPIAWITSGKVDAVVDIRFGRDPGDQVDIQALLGEIAANLSAAATGATPSAPDASSNDVLGTFPSPSMPDRIPGQRELARPALSAPSEDVDLGDWQDPSQLVMDIDLRFRDVKAAIPLFTSDLSYTRSALIRPIVAFINSNRTLVPIRCRVVKDLREFNGSWTIWQTGLSDDVSVKTYEALAHHVANANQRRLKTVSLWSLRMTAGAISAALRNIVDSHAPRPHELG